MIKIFESKLLALAKKYKNLVVLNADFSEVLGLKEFSKVFGERHFNFGLAETNSVAASAGFIARGKIPMIVGFGNFLAGRAWEQIRDVICVNNLNVKLIGIGGIADIGEGPAYQSFEDLSLMRTLPNMKVVIPGDRFELESALEKTLEVFGPVYLRLSAQELPDIFDRNYKFEFGKIKETGGSDELVIFANGAMLSVAKKMSGRVVNVSSLKPIDVNGIIEIAKEAKACVTLEEHSIYGGLGSAIAELLSEHCPKKLKRIGVNDVFGSSARNGDLIKELKLDEESILEAVKNLI